MKFSRNPDFSVNQISMRACTSSRSNFSFSNESFKSLSSFLQRSLDEVAPSSSCRTRPHWAPRSPLRSPDETLFFGADDTNCPRPGIRLPRRISVGPPKCDMRKSYHIQNELFLFKVFAVLLEDFVLIKVRRRFDLFEIWSQARKILREVENAQMNVQLKRGLEFNWSESGKTAASVRTGAVVTSYAREEPATVLVAKQEMATHLNRGTLCSEVHNLADRCQAVDGSKVRHARLTRQPRLI